MTFLHKLAENCTTYGDKVALVSVGETNMLSAVVITDNGVANMQRLVFEQLWNSLPAK